MADNTPVDYGTGQHWANQDALAAVAQAAQEAYQKELLRSGNRDLAEKAANDAATQGRDLIQIYGQQAIQAMSQAAQTGLGVANLLASLQGPANAFAYDRAINGINGATGLSNSIGALTGAYHPTSFQAMGPTSPLTLNSLGQDTSGGNSSIIDQLLGVASNATGQQQQVQQGKLPFSIPQYDPNGAGTTTGGQQPTVNNQTSSTGGATSSDQTVGTQQPANVTINHHYYGDSPSAPNTLSPLSSGGSQLSATQGAYNTALANGGGNTGGAMAYDGTGGTGTYNNSAAQPNYGGGAPGPQFSMAPTTSASLGTPQYSPQTQMYLNALPNVNDVNAKNFAAQDPYTRQLQLSGFAAKGYDPNQLQYRFAQQLPQFKSPQFSMVG